jgi:hypothetical protein
LREVSRLSVHRPDVSASSMTSGTRRFGDVQTLVFTPPRLLFAAFWSGRFPIAVRSHRGDHFRRGFVWRLHDPSMDGVCALKGPACSHDRARKRRRYADRPISPEFCLLRRRIASPSMPPDAVATAVSSPRTTASPSNASRRPNPTKLNGQTTTTNMNQRAMSGIVSPHGLPRARTSRYERPHIGLMATTDVTATGWSEPSVCSG